MASFIQPMAFRFYLIPFLMLSVSAWSERTITFAGYEWSVKESSYPVGPGPNYFSSNTSDIFVDASGLHLKIVQRNGKWQSTECVLKQSLGYGTYVIQTGSRVDILDANMVLGIFTWDSNAPQYHYRELDFEFARWGKPLDPTNAQFVVQPYTTPANIVRYTSNLTPPRAPQMTLLMDWSAGQADFKAYYGYSQPPSMLVSNLVYEWRNQGPDVPPAGGENFRFNFWLMDGKPPLSGAGDEALINDFKYYPPGTFPTPTPTPAPESLLIDDLEDANFTNKLGGAWEMFNGNGVCNPCGTLTQILSQPGLSGSQRALSVSGSIPDDLGGYAFAGVTSRFGATSTSAINLSAYEWIAFDFQATEGGPYSVRLEDAGHVAAGYLGYQQPHFQLEAHSNPVTYQIPLDHFASGNEGVNLEQVANIVWVPTASIPEARFGVKIDNLKAITLPSENANWILY